MHAGEDERGTAAGLVGADDPVAADGDALGPCGAPGLHDIDLGARGIDADAEAGERAVPDHRVPARREGVHDALRDRRPRQPAGVYDTVYDTHDAPSFPAPAAGAMSAPMLAPTLAADTLSVSRARWA